MKQNFPPINFKIFLDLFVVIVEQSNLITVGGKENPFSNRQPVDYFVGITELTYRTTNIRSSDSESIYFVQEPKRSCR